MGGYVAGGGRSPEARWKPGDRQGGGAEVQVVSRSDFSIRTQQISYIQFQSSPEKTCQETERTFSHSTNTEYLTYAKHWS